MESNNTMIDDYLYEFYGPGGRWFAIYYGVTSAFIVISNIFFTILALTSKTLRQNTANWFLIGLSISDQLHYGGHVVGAYAVYTGSVDNRHLCAVAGAIVLVFGACSFGFPAMIAADRYYKISTISHTSNFSIGRALFSKRGSILLIISWFIISGLSDLPLALNDCLGEDPSGFCGDKKFTSVPLLLAFEISVIFPFVGAMILTAIYYYRLTKWLKQHQAASTRNRHEVDYTRAIMRVMKIVTLMPLILDSPTVILSAGQMILPEMPMWIKRLLVAPYFLSSAANPWLTIALVRQFRFRFRQLIFNTKTKTTVIDFKNVDTTHRTSTVHPLQPDVIRYNTVSHT